MTRLLRPLFALLASTTDSKLRQMVEYLQEENKILRSKLPKRITVIPGERARLVKLGTALGGALKAIITIVSPRTFARWVTGATTPKAKPPGRQQGGRPRTAEDIRNLIIQIANENGWGSLRVAGELRKLGIHNVSRSTVVNILREANLDPGPKRGEGTWSEFLRRHADTLWASDFISVRTLTPKGVVDLYLLFFVHIGSRKVIVSAPTAHPDSAWVTQQARDASMQTQDWGLSMDYLITDHDGKYTESFDAVFDAEDAEIIRVGPSAPNLNAYAERWVRTLRYRPSRGPGFNANRVRQLFVKWRMTDTPSGSGAGGLPGAKEWWLADLARELGVGPVVVHQWRWYGWLHARQLLGKAGRVIVWADRDEVRRLRRLRAYEVQHRNQRDVPAELTTPKDRSNGSKKPNRNKT